MMLERIEFHHRLETSTCLQITIAAQRPLSLEAFNDALPGHNLNMEETQKLIHRCGGLLEVQSRDSG